MQVSSLLFCRLPLQLNEALADSPLDTTEYSLKQELTHIVRTATRIADCMAKYVPFRNAFNNHDS
jgi:hypothetical protein